MLGSIEYYTMENTILHNGKWSITQKYIEYYTTTSRITYKIKWNATQLKIECNVLQNRTYCDSIQESLLEHELT